MTDDAPAGPVLPDGFDDAPHDVQVALLESYQGSELVAGICAELGVDPPRGDQLQKRHKARVLLRLRDSGQVLDDPESYRTGDLSSGFDRVVEHDQGAEAEADGGAVAAAPASWVANAATSVVHESPGTVREMQPDAATERRTDDSDGSEEDDTVQACPECDVTNVYSRQTKPPSERWRCNNCEAVFAEPVERPPKHDPSQQSGDDPDAESDLVADAPPLPSWLGQDPNDILAGAPTGRSLSEIIEVVATSETIMDAHKRLDSTTIGQARGGILGPLGLTGPGGDLPDDATLDDRLTVLAEWVDHD